MGDIIKHQNYSIVAQSENAISQQSVDQLENFQPTDNKRNTIVQQAVAENPKSPQLVDEFDNDIFHIPCEHNREIITKCKSKNDMIVEYSFKDINKPLGISEYQLTKVLPDGFKSFLPSIEEIEAELGRGEE